MLAFRAYGAERRRHAHVEFLYRSMRAMQDAPELRTAVRELLAAARTMLAAEFAEIVFLPTRPARPRPAEHDRPGPRAPARVDGAEQGRDARAVELASGDQDAHPPPARAGEPHELDGYLAERELAGRDRDRAALARTASSVLLLVGQRAGDVSTFNADDRKLFETFASHAAVLLENDRVKEQLRYQAFHDALTGLPNRVLFAEQVRGALSPGRRGAGAVGALPRPRRLQDDQRQPRPRAGDELLVAVAERLRSARPARRHRRPASAATSSRVLLECTATGRRRARRRAPRARAARAVRALTATRCSIHASIGIAGHYGAGTADELLANADVAMYSAKDNGKRGYAVYEPEMHARVRRRHELIAALERAIERYEIRVHYQPIVSPRERPRRSRSRRSRAGSTRRRGLVPPGSFIPIAEENGLIVADRTHGAAGRRARLAAWQRSLDGATRTCR